MILTDRTTTLTVTSSDDTATPIINASQVVTIGGTVKTQADSQRLKITSRMRLTQAEVRTLTAILTNFSAQLFFTPQRLLWDKTTNAEMEVILVGAPSIEERVIGIEDGSTPTVVFWVVCEFEEVI